MRVLFVGDVVGSPGRRVLRAGLKRLRTEHAPDLVIANGENVAGGSGLTPDTVDEMVRAGCDVITSGNHVWDKKEIVPYLERHDRVLRPLNYPAPTPGNGSCIVEARDGTRVCVLNLMGRVFMPALDDPFRVADAFLRALPDPRPPVVVDFHAEATSEKVALGWYLDGRVAAVLGTHTHVATADERVLPRGTAYITDVGMTGPFDSVIGVEKEDVLERFLSQRPRRFRTAEGDARLNAVLLTIAPLTGRAESIVRIELREDEAEALR
jgi:metallophosphoesterase (TIGR00282 family)